VAGCPSVTNQCRKHSLDVVPSSNRNRMDDLRRLSDVSTQIKLDIRSTNSMMLMLVQALTETESSVSLHVSSVTKRHNRNYTLLAVNKLGSDSHVVTLAVVARPGDSAAQQNIVDRPEDVVELVVSQPSRMSTRPLPSLTYTSSSDNGRLSRLTLPYFLFCLFLFRYMFTKGLRKG